ncbi:DUF2933 domain-containing protein [Cryobacterium sp. Sr8]|nr:DUF2933 domain-containing protein [Cryobacterium sp. Sr8]
MPVANGPTRQAGRTTLIDHEPHAGHDSLGEGHGARRRGWVVLGLAALALLIYLVTNHWLHVLDALPYVAVIAMIAMHLGHGHGGHGRHDKRAGGEDGG